MLPPKHSLHPPKYKTAGEFTKHYNPPNYIYSDQLPSKPTDIRGIDSSGYTYLNQSAYHKFPVLSSNEYLQLKFFPGNHFISRIRKSNIALGNFNNPISLLNDPVLEKALKSYRGKYSESGFFNERSHPLSTAVGRARYKKFVKQCLFESVIGKDVTRVRGFYFVRYHKVPVTEQDKASLKEYISNAVSRINNDDKLYQSLVRTSQSLKTPRDLKKNAKLYNWYGAKWEPTYYPKLPFL
ncbi:hypothetical protein CANTEDRAFT_108836 [Yamadazyma tenuis ATCC 10573]|uniref:Uncharacterized protein n=2 Tax=Candida tenuis TaxID=2315449 RepID=G3B8X8_CANTC|nr:uncharacterized protein CANTEDRAFT_108836 [Yamadazyma tenuis ATCC 10573]EGV61803.1 hypothetical protein CANTEDRAFT_108836 [Yamadazyma tenuis ATCC 10573]